METIWGRKSQLEYSRACECSSFSPFLFVHFCSPLTLKEPSYRNEITKLLKLTFFDVFSEKKCNSIIPSQFLGNLTHIINCLFSLLYIKHLPCPVDIQTYSSLSNLQKKIPSLDPTSPSHFSSSPQSQTVELADSLFQFSHFSFTPQSVWLLSSNFTKNSC